MSAVKLLHEVSVIVSCSREFYLNLSAARVMRLGVQEIVPGTRIMAGNRNAEQQPTSDSSAWWWSHVRPHALQKLLSGGFFVRKESPLRDNDQLSRNDSRNRTRSRRKL